MYTLGYSLPAVDARPKSIADGAVDPRLRPRDRARARHRASRSASTTASCAPSGRPTDARWTVEAERTDTGETVQLTCGFLFICTRLLPLRRGLHAASSRASSASRGQIVHPQHWPEDLDYAGKRVVVIGSGATAVTLVPAMAETRRARDDAAALARATSSRCPARTRSPSSLRRVLPAKAAYAIVRWKNVLLTMAVLPAQPPPARAGQAAAAQGRRAPAAAPATTSTRTSSRSYNPWDQRLCLVPDGDLFEAISRGQRLGRHRPRSTRSPRRASRLDVRRASSRPTSIVTATGLNLLALGGMRARRRRRARSTSPRRSATRA